MPTVPPDPQRGRAGLVPADQPVPMGRRWLYGPAGTLGAGTALVGFGMAGENATDPSSDVLFAAAALGLVALDVGAIWAYLAIMNRITVGTGWMPRVGAPPVAGMLIAQLAPPTWPWPARAALAALVGAAVAWVMVQLILDGPLPDDPDQPL
ncbi:MAG: hypothetical protein LWW86_02795 [Micrococcales bacterium]|nr:hypothetical protein [Micrococcales bacterium]